MKRERSKGDYNEKYSEYADNDEDGGMLKEKKKKNKTFTSCAHHCGCSYRR